MSDRKKVCVSIPCYNEVDNVVPLTEELQRMFRDELQKYDLCIQFIDNNSTDGTQEKLRGLCKKYKNVRAILNAKNFPMTSGYYGMLQAVGDCTVQIPSDFQIPLDMIPKMIAEWENGAKIVCMAKKTAEESSLLWHVRQLFYAIEEKFTNGTIIKNYSGSGLYDKSFLDICRKIDDPESAFLDAVSAMGYDIVVLEYDHKKRKSGKSKNNIWTLFNIAIARLTNSSTSIYRVALMVGFMTAFLSLLIGFIYLIMKLVFWKNFIAGMAPVLIGVFFMGSIQIFLIGIVGEYIMKANRRLMKRPLVIERERLNFDDI